MNNKSEGEEVSHERIHYSQPIKKSSHKIQPNPEDQLLPECQNLTFFEDSEVIFSKKNHKKLAVELLKSFGITQSDWTYIRTICKERNGNSHVKLLRLTREQWENNIKNAVEMENEQDKKVILEKLFIKARCAIEEERNSKKQK